MLFITRVTGWITLPIDQRTYDLSERLPVSEEYMGKASLSGHDTGVLNYNEREPKGIHIRQFIGTTGLPKG